MGVCLRGSWPRRWLAGRGLVLLAGFCGCTVGQAARTVPPPVTSVAAPPVAAEPSVGPELARFFLGQDIARTERVRRPNVVLLFAPPGPLSGEAVLASVEKLRLQPLVCALRGKLAFGARCGEAMPPRAEVRLTDAGDSGHEVIAVERSRAAFRDEAGSHVYQAPYEPACCMYNTCVGRTVPYYPKETSPHHTLSTTRMVLAVWPADAEIELSIFEPGVSDEVKLDDAPWVRRASEGPPRFLQSALFRGRRYASVSGRGMESRLFADLGKGWQPLLREMGVRDYFLLAASDLDGNGAPELLVYARWANDYGFQVLANDAPAPQYGFSCGNI